MGTWAEDETAGCDLGDLRLNRRLGAMLAALGERPGKSLPTAFQDWANTKAAYRFFANENVSEDKILAGHFAASGLRVRATDGPILVLQDTTKFSFKRAAPEKIGFTKTSCGRKGKEGRHSQHMICGMLMHASLAVTPEGLPLGLTAAKFWSREKFKGTKALARKVNPTRVPIEQKESMRWLDNLRLSTELIGAPERCVHIGDRESDIYELFCLAGELGTNFLVRSCVNRLAEDGDTTIAQVMAGIEPGGTHLVRTTLPDMIVLSPISTSRGSENICREKNLQFFPIFAPISFASSTRYRTRSVRFSSPSSRRRRSFVRRGDERGTRSSMGRRRRMVFSFRFTWL